jgi:hypothetical protein
MNKRNLSNSENDFDAMETRVRILEEKVESLARYIDGLKNADKSNEGVPPDEYFAPIRQAKVFAYE